MERKLIKCLENLKVEYDGTVRRSDGAVLQFQYGDDGVDGMHSAFLPALPLPAPWPHPSLREGVEHAACVASRARLDALPFDRLTIPVDLAVLESGVKALEGVAATSDDAIDGVSALLRRLGSTQLFEDAVRLRYASGRVCREAWSKTRLGVVLDLVGEHHDRHLVQPGEMVGVLAAQSIAEPATQQELRHPLHPSSPLF